MNNKAKVAIIMGSDSDLAVMQQAAEILDQFQISYYISVVSAHRTPDRMYAFAKAAEENNFELIIAGAGGSAHLPGMVAALTSVPVIGVPVQSKSLSGVDSLYSIVQMPPGIPVATVAINGAKNAGLLAIQILATHDKELKAKLQTFRKNQQEEVEQKAKNLEEKGWQKYSS